MKKEVLLALITTLVDEAVKDYSSQLTPKSIRGPRGESGRDFNYDEHQSQIIEDVSKELLKHQELFKLKFSDLSDEEKLQLKGERGQDGHSVTLKDVWPKVKNYVDQIKDSLKLKFSDLSDDEKLQLKGDKGQDGQSVTLDDIRPIVAEYFDKVKPELKLKFSDLSSEDRLLLKGDKGPRGQRGKGFDYEEDRDFVVQDLKRILSEIKSELTLTFDKLTESEKASLKLKFSDLTEEELSGLKLTFDKLTQAEKDSLKLKFSDLTDEEKLTLKGPRGQRGKQGEAGKDFDYSENRENIVKDLAQAVRDNSALFKLRFHDLTDAEKNSLKGKSGFNGRDGRDGRNAPQIIDIGVEQVDEKFSLVFYFDDNTKIETDRIQLPVATQVYQAMMAAYTAMYIEKDGVAVGVSNTLNFTGTNVTVTQVDGKIQVAIADDFVVESANYLTVERVLDEDITAGTLVSASSGTNVVIAQPTDAQKSRVLGMLLTSGTTGQTRRVLLFGNTTLTSSFTLNVHLYLTSNGQISETPPLPASGVTGYITEVAFSNGTNSVFINPKSPLEVVG